MAQPQIQFLFDTPFTASDWLEAVNLFSPAQLRVGKKQSTSTLTAYIEDFNKLKNCIHWLRGYSWVDENLDLRRQRPARHPFWPNMVCTEIVDVTGLQFDSKQEIISDEMDLAYAKYKKFKVTVVFNSVPYLIMDDGVAETEDERWTMFPHKPYVDFYELPAGTIKFIADNPPQPWDGKPIMGPRTVIRTQKSLYELKWFDVPISFVYDSNGASPKIDAAIGKISSDEYAGKPAGTFLLDDAEFDIYNDPIVGDILGNVGRMVDVTFHLKFWDPPLGHATNTTRGWTLELAQDGLAYPTQRATGTTPKYQSVEIASLFRHWNLP